MIKETDKDIETKKQRILITGGSGFLGINLIRYLIKKGFKDIVVIDIVNLNYPDVLPHVQFIEQDIRDEKRVKEIMDEVGVVIHAASALPLNKRDNIFSTIVNGSINLLSSAFNSQVTKFIYISSTAVYGVPEHHPILEEDNLIGVGPYGEAKIKAEEAALSFRKRGMCVPILRPKSFIGPERLGIFGLLFEWAKDGRNFPLIGKGDNHYQLLDVEDLCEAIYLCIQLSDNKTNDTFNIGAEEFKTMKEDFQSVLDRAGYGKKMWSFPSAPSIFLLRILEVLNLSPVYKWIYDSAAKESIVSVEKAKRNLGFSPKYSNQKALIRSFEWYLKNADNLNREFGTSHTSPWKQGILNILKKFF